MTICKCISEPNRNDAYGKDGYSALCPNHKDQVGKYPRTESLDYKKKEEIPSKPVIETPSNVTTGDKEYQKIQKDFHFLKCWICGSNQKGEMLICQCKSEPNRNDGYAKNGYSALCKLHLSKVGESDNYCLLKGGNVKESVKQAPSEEMIVKKY